jgi:hypothetical protein
MTRDEVIAAITHAARAVVHAKGAQASVKTLDMALQAADAEGYGDAAHAIAAAIVDELADVPSAATSAAPASTKGVWVTVTVEWRLSKPPEKQPTWQSSLDGKGKKSLHHFHNSFYLTPEAFVASMETEAGITKLEKLIYDHVKKQAAGEPAWLVFADVRLGQAGSGWDGWMQARKLPSALHYNYWQNKSGPTSFGPASGWWWTRPKFGGGYVYQSVQKG